MRWPISVSFIAVSALIGKSSTAQLTAELSTVLTPIGASLESAPTGQLVGQLPADLVSVLKRNFTIDGQSITEPQLAQLAHHLTPTQVLAIEAKLKSKGLLGSNGNGGHAFLLKTAPDNIHGGAEGVEAAAAPALQPAPNLPTVYLRGAGGLPQNGQLGFVVAPDGKSYLQVQVENSSMDENGQTKFRVLDVNSGQRSYVELAKFSRSDRSGQVVVPQSRIPNLDVPDPVAGNTMDLNGKTLAERTLKLKEAVEYQMKNWAREHPDAAKQFIAAQKNPADKDYWSEVLAPELNIKKAATNTTPKIEPSSPPAAKLPSQPSEVTSAQRENAKLLLVNRLASHKPLDPAERANVDLVLGNGSVSRIEGGIYRMRKAAPADEIPDLMIQDEINQALLRAIP